MHVPACASLLPSLRLPVPVCRDLIAHRAPLGNLHNEAYVLEQAKVRFAEELIKTLQARPQVDVPSASSVAAGSSSPAEPDRKRYKFE
jgi:hypothetical protein